MPTPDPTQPHGLLWKLARVPGYDRTAWQPMASALAWVRYLDPGSVNVIRLRPDNGPAYSLYEVAQVAPFREVRPGWYQSQIRLRIDSMEFDALPATVYFGDSSSEPSLLLKVDETYPPTGDLPPTDPRYIAPGTWILTATATHVVMVDES